MVLENGPGRDAGHYSVLAIHGKCWNAGGMQGKSTLCLDPHTGVTMPVPGLQLTTPPDLALCKTEDVGVHRRVDGEFREQSGLTVALTPPPSWDLTLSYDFLTCLSIGL